MTTGRRYTGPEAAAAGIVAAAYELDQLVDEAVGWAAAQAGKAGPTLAAIKQQMYAPALRILDKAEAGAGR